MMVVFPLSESISSGSSTVLLLKRAAWLLWKMLDSERPYSNVSSVTVDFILSELSIAFCIAFLLLVLIPFFICYIIHKSLTLALCSAYVSSPSAMPRHSASVRPPVIKYVVNTAL